MAPITVFGPSYLSLPLLKCECLYSGTPNDRMTVKKDPTTQHELYS